MCTEQRVAAKDLWDLLKKIMQYYCDAKMPSSIITLAITPHYGHSPWLHTLLIINTERRGMHQDGVSSRSISFS